MKQRTIPRQLALLLTAILAPIVVCLALFFKTFVFSPIGFATDVVIDAPWHWYRKPLLVEYWCKDTSEKVAIEDTAEAIFVLKNLRSSLSTSLELPDYSTFTPTIIVNIKRVSDGQLLLTIDGDKLDGYFVVQDRVRFILPTSLKELLEERINHGRR